MRNQKTYSVIRFVLLLLLLGFIGACQETLVEPNPATSSAENLEKDSGLRIPDTYVHGYVTRNGNPVVGAKVELWKNGNFLPYGPADSPYSDSNGFYEICICCKGEGSGYYTVKTEIDVRGDTWASSSSFLWNDSLGPFDFSKNLPLAITEDKSSE